MSIADPQKRISAAAIQALKGALTHAYWYKPDLRSFLNHTISDPAILSRINWDDYKRNIVVSVVDFLARNEDQYQETLLRLMGEVVNINDLSHLAKLDDGNKKVSEAQAALDALRSQMAGHLTIMEESREIARRRAESQHKLVQLNAIKDRLEELRQDFLSLVVSTDSQQRGFKLEKILRGLFEVFDLDPKASFRITGEQIDGAFSFENTDYLLEAKWQKVPTGAADLDIFSAKVARKLENTLGVFLSINGYSQDGVAAHSAGRRLVILVDGGDLMAVLEGRIDLVQLLLRKRREAAQTGNLYLKVQEILMHIG